MLLKNQKALQLICYFIGCKTTIICIIMFLTIALISSNILMYYEQSIVADPGKNGSGKGHKNNDGNDRNKGGDHGKKNNNENRGENKKADEKKAVDEKKDIEKVNQVSTKVYRGFAFSNESDNRNESFNFVAAGDFGCNSNTKSTVENMIKSNPELVLPLGDLSYQKSANCWFDAMAPLKGKIMITLGYHDVNDGEAKLGQYFNSFEINKPYYSFDYRKTHFIVMASESQYQIGSDQYNFVKQDLEKTSNRTDIDWIIVTSYNPFYSSPSKHTGEKGLRSLYHPLFEKHGVDLVLHGHNHNYQRTYPISYNPKDGSEPNVKYNFTTGYNDRIGGTVFATVGTGGESFYPLLGKSYYVATQLDRFGYLNVQIDNGNPHTSLTGTFLDNIGSEMRDQFTIEKQIK